MFTGNLKNVTWAYLGKAGSSEYSIPECATTKIPGAFVACHVTPEELGRINWSLVEQLVRNGTEELDGEAVVITGISNDGKAIGFRTFSSMPYGGVFAPGIPHMSNTDMDEWVLENGVVVPAFPSL